MRRRDDDLEAFWLRVDRRGPDECWEWTGSRKKGRRQYGNFSVQGRYHHAHRWIYAQLHGPVQPSMDVCHSCDNPPCCNPAHLFVGTRRDNMVDMARKGRGKFITLRGESAINARLTAELVRQIRASTDQHTEWAKRLGLSYSTVRNARIGRTWAHIKDDSNE